MTEQSKSIQSAKDEAKNFLVASGLYEYGTISMSHDALSTLLASYHASALEKAGEGLPELSDENIIHKIRQINIGVKFTGEGLRILENHMKKIVDWYRLEAVLLLAKKEKEKNDLKKELERTKNMWECDKACLREAQTRFENADAKLTALKSPASHTEKETDAVEFQMWQIKEKWFLRRASSGEFLFFQEPVLPSDMGKSPSDLYAKFKSQQPNKE